MAYEVIFYPFSVAIIFRLNFRLSSGCFTLLHLCISEFFIAVYVLVQYNTSRST